MTNVVKSFLSALAFAVVSFIILFIFDFLNFSPNSSGVMDSLSALEIISFFSVSAFNGLYTLCLGLAILIFIFGSIR